MIHFNDKEDKGGRRKTKALTLKQELKVIEILNSRLAGGYRRYLSKADIALIQRFVNHYQNLCHFKAYTTGLYATDRKELAKHKDFFQIK